MLVRYCIICDICRSTHNRYHRKMVTTNSPSYLITLLILIPSLWETAKALDAVKFKNICIGLSAYIGAVLAASVIYNVTLLKYSQKTEKQFICTTNARFKFTETVTLILASLVAAYLPLIITLAIISCRFIHSTDGTFIIVSYRALLLKFIPPQENVVLYFADVLCKEQLA